MTKELLKGVRWFRVLRSYSTEDWDECLKRLSIYEDHHGLNSYGKALRATVWLYQEKFEIAEKLFAELADGEPVGANDRYVALYCAARFHAMNGNDEAVRAAELKASSIRCSFFIKRRLPVE